MKLIRSLHSLAAVCIALLSPLAVSQSYRAQATLLGYASEGDYEEFQDNSYRAGMIEALFYLAPVELGDGPWAQASFLNRSSYIGLQKVSGTLEREALVDVSGGTGNAMYEFRDLDDIDVDSRSAYGRYVFSNGLTTDVMVSKREEAAPTHSYDEDTVGLSLGSYVRGQNWWGVEYRRLKVSQHWEETEHDVHAYGVRVHHLLRENDRVFVSVEYGLLIENGREVDDANELYGNFTVYLNKQLGLNFGVTVRDEEARDRSEVDIGVEYFIVPQISSGLHFVAHQIDYENSSVDYIEEGILLELTGRI